MEMRLNELHKDIVNHGLKVTPQRISVLKYLRENRIHPTAEKIYSEIIKEYPALSLTTVYKTLASFVEAGMVKELDVDSNKKRFDSSLEPHDHFHCRVCDNVYDVICNSDFSINNLADKKKVEGHCVDTINIHMKGVCKYCEAVSP